MSTNSWAFRQNYGVISENCSSEIRLDWIGLDQTGLEWNGIEWNGLTGLARLNLD